MIAQLTAEQELIALCQILGIRIVRDWNNWNVRLITPKPYRGMKDESSPNAERISNFFYSSPENALSALKSYANK